MIDANFQLSFLRKLQRIFGEGQFSATYKFALLHALADIAVERNPGADGKLSVSLSELGIKFIELYWRHAEPFKENEELAQNTGRPAAIFTQLHRLRHDYQTFSSLRRSEDWARAAREAGNLVERMPLLRLQIIAGEEDDFLYHNQVVDDAIELKPGVAFCLRTFYPLIVHLVRSRWLQFIRAIPSNANLLGAQSDLESFLFGTDRNSLSTAIPFLQEVQSNRCFYCDKAISKNPQVDHFVPWSRYPHDLGHNFVLAHDSCNSNKSDTLAAREHVQRWLARNERDGAALESEFSKHFVCNPITSRSIAFWSYELDSGAGARLWKLGDQYTDFDNGILSLLDTA